MPTNLVNLWALYYAPYPERRARMRRHLRQQYVDTAPRGQGHKAHRRAEALLCQAFQRLMGLKPQTLNKLGTRGRA